jgi:hypothetical protein
MMNRFTPKARHQLLVGAILAAVLLCSQGLQAQKPITVFVSTTSESSQARSKSKEKEVSDSAKDLRKEIEKRGNIALAEDIEAADIVVTILDRRIDVAQYRQDYGAGHIQPQYQSRHLIHYRIQVGEFHQDAEYYIAGSLVTWKRVAKDVSKRIERWARENREQVLQARSSKF